MDSRIILSQADFSQNNIGRYVVLSELTKAVLAKQTKYDQQSDEAFALNLFLTNLTEEGFIGGSSPKLTVLMLPCLAKANTPFELFYNIASLDGSGYPSNWAPSVMTNYVQTDKGVLANAVLNNITDDIGFKLASTDFFTASSRPAGFSYFAYLYDSNMNASDLITRDIMADTNGLVFKLSGLRAQVGNGDNIITTTLDGYESITTISKGFYGMSYKPGTIPSDDTLIVNMNGNTTATTTKNGTVMTFSDVSKANNNSILLQGKDVNSARPNASVVAFGYDLSAVELATIKGYVDTLMSALNI